MKRFVASIAYSALAAAVFFNAGSALAANEALDKKNGFQTWKLGSPIPAAHKNDKLVTYSTAGRTIDRVGFKVFKAGSAKVGNQEVKVTLCYYKDKLMEIVLYPTDPYRFRDTIVAAYGEIDPHERDWVGQRVTLVWDGDKYIFRNNQLRDEMFADDRSVYHKELKALEQAQQRKRKAAEAGAGDL